MQLHTQRMLALKESKLPVLDFNSPVDQDYGICDDDVSPESVSPGILIPPISLQLTYNQQLALKEHIFTIFEQ